MSDAALDEYWKAYRRRRAPARPARLLSLGDFEQIAPPRGGSPARGSGAAALGRGRPVRAARGRPPLRARARRHRAGRGRGNRALRVGGRARALRGGADGLPCLAENLHAGHRAALRPRGLSRGGQTAVPAADLPLAARMRPASLGEFVGQEHLLGRGSALRTAIEEGRPHSMILYGPPGTGKTTLARMLAVNARAAFEEESAVNAGRAEVREVLARARAPAPAPAASARSSSSTRSTASTRPSRTPCCPRWRRGSCRWWAPRPRTPTSRSTRRCCRAAACTSCARSRTSTCSSCCAARWTTSAASPTRRRWTTRRSSSWRAARAATRAARCPRSSSPPRPWAAGQSGHVSVAEDALQRSAVLYDKGGDKHYDLISAWIKSTRGSDPDASLLYLAAMLEGGEDPRFIARRMVILASEDIGNADPRALEVAVSAAHAVEHVGHAGVRAQPRPGGGLPGAGAQVERLLRGARPRARVGARARTPLPPAALQSAAYPGAKKLGRGEGYDYPHDRPEGVSRSGADARRGRWASASWSCPSTARRRELRERLERIRKPRRGSDRSLMEAASALGRPRARVVQPARRRARSASVRHRGAGPGAGGGGRRGRGPAVLGAASAGRPRALHAPAGQAIIDQLDDLASCSRASRASPINESYAMELLPDDRLAPLARGRGPGHPRGRAHPAADLHQAEARALHLRAARRGRA